MIVKLCEQGKQYTDTLDDSPVMVTLPFRFRTMIIESAGIGSDVCVVS
jgi:hypothetical protein